MRSGDRSKLPVWAQELISGLEARNEAADASYRRLLAQVTGENPDTDTFINSYDVTGPNKGLEPLLRGAKVRFQTGPHSRDFVEVGLSKDGIVDVYAGDAIAITPRASNTISITRVTW